MHFVFWFLFFAMPLLAVAFVARVALWLWQRVTAVSGEVAEVADHVGTVFADAPQRGETRSFGTRRA